MQKQKNSLSIPTSIILAGFLIAVGIYFSIKNNTPTIKNTETIKSNIIINTISKTDHILGNPNAPIIMMEFSDIECPGCKVFQDTIQIIKDTYIKDGKVALIYKHFPLDQIHTKSRKEAEATECANELGGDTAFWKMLNTIYAKTPSNDKLDLAKLPEFAKEIGIDVLKFNECLSSGKYTELVEANFQDGIKAGVKGTPYNIFILKNTLSNDAEKTLQDFILKNNLSQNITISSNKKEISSFGAFPIEIMKTILDIILK
ncbi:MAG: DsbA family protein [bacterium]